jgi:predicted ATPase
MTDADNPSNLVKFQIEESASDTFLDIAQSIYGYECYLEKEVEEYDSQAKKNVSYFTDFVIVKEDDGEDYEPVHVHYRTMSAGERKIATMLRQMCSPLHKDVNDIYLIDNLELHAHMLRHTVMVDKVKEYFSDKQIIATSHSPILVGLPGVIKPYMKKEELHDVVAIRKKWGSAGKKTKARAR